MKRFFCYIYILSILSTSQSFAQTQDCLTLSPDSNINFSLLYAVDIQANAAQGQYLVPTIENLLLKLNIPNSGNKPRFAKVANANRLLEEKNMSEYIEKLVDTYLTINTLSLKSSDERDSAKEVVIKDLMSYDDFLHIKIKSLQNSFIEYQFYRYDIISLDTLGLDSVFSDPAQSASKDLPLHHYLRSSSIFVNPDDEPSVYIQSLQKAIKQVFCETNIRPIGNIASNHTIDQDTSFFALNDSIKLEAQIFDNDSREELFTYSWREILGENQPPSLEIEDNASNQLFKVNQIGCYTVGLQVHDGIIYSEKEDTLTICVRPKPVIQPYGQSLYRESWGIAFQIKKTFFNRFFYDTDKVYTPTIQIACGQVSTHHPDSTFLRLTPSKYYAQKGLKFGHAKIAPDQQDRIKAFEKAYDFMYDYGLFYKLQPLESTSTPTVLRPTEFSLKIQPNKAILYQPGIYRFELQAFEKELKSEPVLLTMRTIKASWFSLDFAQNNLKSTTFATNRNQFAFGGRAEIVPYAYVQAGTRLRSQRPVGSSSAIYHGKLYVGLEVSVPNYLFQITKRKYPVLGVGKNKIWEVETGVAMYRVFNNMYGAREESIDPQTTAMRFFITLNSILGAFGFEAGFDDMDNSFGQEELVIGFRTTVNMFRRRGQK